jgi:hypothetical protein
MKYKKIKKSWGYLCVVDDFLLSAIKSKFLCADFTCASAAA